MSAASREQTNTKTVLAAKWIFVNVGVIIYERDLSDDAKLSDVKEARTSEALRQKDLVEKVLWEM